MIITRVLKTLSLSLSLSLVASSFYRRRSFVSWSLSFTKREMVGIVALIIVTRSPDASIRTESPVCFADTTLGRFRIRPGLRRGRSRRTRLARILRWRLSVPLVERTRRCIFCGTASWRVSTLERLSTVEGCLVGGRRRRRARRRLSVRIKPGFPKLGINCSRCRRGEWSGRKAESALGARGERVWSRRRPRRTGEV